MSLTRYLPFLDLRTYHLSSLRCDVLAGTSVMFLDIPQGVAYAMIAGLPPAVGLYAAVVPAIVGALFRSSRHVITGSTNSVSLLVGSAVASLTVSSDLTPMTVGLTLAFLVGVMQVAAGLLRLDALADYISHPVVRGYITGAAVLIAAGQLANVTGTPGTNGTLFTILTNWLGHLPSSDLLAVAFAAGTILFIIGLRRVSPRLPGSIIAMVASITVSSLFHLHESGLRLVADLSPIPSGFPPFTLPSLTHWTMLMPAAIACAVLSLVESSSVARVLAAESRQRLDLAAEFAGQGLANMAAAFSSGYPVSGSLSRSTLNRQAGAESRVSALFCGLLMILVLLFFGPLVARTPIASLAGLLLVLATDLVDYQHIRAVMNGTRSDRAAFIITLAGTWILPLDKAIYLGVAISIVLFLQRARLLTVREMVIGEKGRFREIELDSREQRPACASIRILNLTGPLFFAVAGELESVLEPAINNPEIRVLILRVRQAHDFDVTTANVLDVTAKKLATEGRTLLLLGLRPPALALLKRTGIATRIGADNLFPAQSGWFTAMEAALHRAIMLTGEHACGNHCPFVDYVSTQEDFRTTTEISSKTIWTPDL